MDNGTIAERLRAHARSLDGRPGQLYRARAYRRAAASLEWFGKPVAELLASDGVAALESLPGVGRHLAYTIAALAATGEWRTWDDRPRRPRAG